MAGVADSPSTISEFAAELEGRVEESLFAHVYQGDPPSRSLAQSEHLVAFVDLAPLVAGHLIVVPRQDVPSFASLSRAAWHDWQQLRIRLVELLTRQWAPPVLFEHGSTSAMRGSACITHAHLQLLPADIDLAQEMRTDGLDVFEVDDQRTLRDRADGRERPYFFVEAADGTAQCAWADDPPMPSQYLRRIAARALGLSDPEWDWGVVVRRELLRGTVRKLTPVVRDA